VLQAANFRSKRSWFGSDIADNTANTKSEFEFWVIAGEADDCKLVAPLAQKPLVLSCSAMGIIGPGDVERCDKVTARTRTKVSNRKSDSTTEAYCKIAVSESNRRRKVQVPNAVQALRSRLRKLTKLRGESASAAEAIAEASRAGDGDTDLEGDEHAELDLLLDEITWL
jgi:hypothetical protein